MKEKKQSDVAVLLRYAGNYRGLTFLGLSLSAVAMILGMAPYICIWLVARDLIEVAPNWTLAAGVARYGWMAFGFAVAGILVYFAALMCTHLAAFRTASNIRKQGMEHLMKTPLGFFEPNRRPAAIACHNSRLHGRLPLAKVVFFVYSHFAPDNKNPHR